MQRREFLVLVGAAVALPRTGRAQVKAPTRRVGVLMSIAENDAEGPGRVAAFEEGLRAAGWNDRNLRVDWRWGAGDSNRIRAHAAQLVAMNMDVIVANSPQVTGALLKETQNTPIVFVQVADPVGSGLVSNLARPGRNVTGFASFEPELGGKWFEILKAIAPRVTRILIMLDSQFLGYVALAQMIEAVGQKGGVLPIVARVHNSAEIRDAIVRFAKEPDGGVIVLPSPVTAVERELIIALAAEHRTPAIYPYRFFAASGGLVSYGVETFDFYRQAAVYVDRILKGEQPGNLPVQRPTKFDFVINLRTAKQLGLEVPRRLLVGATDVIQ